MADAYRCDTCKKFYDGTCALQVSLLTQKTYIAEMMNTGSVAFVMCDECAISIIRKLIPNARIRGPVG